MKLSINCQRCKQLVPFSANVSDRFELARKRGAQIDLRCRACNHQGAYHVNEIEARSSSATGVVAVAVFLIATALILFSVWDYLFDLANVYALAGFAGIFIAPCWMYEAIMASQREKVRYFNRKNYG